MATATATPDPRWRSGQPSMRWGSDTASQAVPSPVSAGQLTSCSGVAGWRCSSTAASGTAARTISGLPGTHVEYWTAKIERNRERDIETDALLAEAGWTVVRVWEHEDPNRGADRVRAVLTRG